MSYIQRAITPILKQRVSTSKCMLLVGARQVGKSTLIKHEFKDLDRKSTRLNSSHKVQSRMPSSA